MSDAVFLGRGNISSGPLPKGAKGGPTTDDAVLGQISCQIHSNKKACKHCGQDFTPSMRSSRPQIFCSSVCANRAAGKAAHLRNKAKPRLMMTTNCKHCGVEYRTTVKLDGSGPTLKRCQKCQRRGAKRTAEQSRIYMRQYIKKNRAKISAHLRERFATDADYRARKAAYKKRNRAKKLAAGLRYDGKSRCLIREASRVREMERKVRYAALQAWSHWLKVKAPAAWIAAYYSSHPKPWTNPRLTSAEKFRIRYALDPEFAQQQRERTSARRFQNPNWAAMWSTDGTRWLRAAKSSDGTITSEFLKAIRRETHCAYCHEPFNRADRKQHLDHVWPLRHGGEHSADNLVAACGPCNRLKLAKLPLQWLLREAA